MCKYMCMFLAIDSCIKCIFLKLESNYSNIKYIYKKIITIVNVH